MEYSSQLMCYLLKVLYYVIKYWASKQQPQIKCMLTSCGFISKDNRWACYKFTCHRQTFLFSSTDSTDFCITNDRISTIDLLNLSKNKRKKVYKNKLIKVKTNIESKTKIFISNHMQKGKQKLPYNTNKHNSIEL